MKQLFKISFVLLITVQTLQAQKHEIFNKSFDAENLEKIDFDLENATVLIEPSSDMKVHITHTVELKNYKKKEARRILKDIYIDASVFYKTLVLRGQSITKTYGIELHISDTLALRMPLNKKKDKRTLFKKSKDSIIAEINNRLLPSSGILKKLNSIFSDSVKVKKSLKISRSNFTIKVPANLSLEIYAKNSMVTIKGNLENQIEAHLKRGSLVANILSNQNNKILLESAALKAVEINGGHYTLKNSMQSLVGSIANTKLNTEFSTIEVGEIKENNTITDFKSEFNLYNFSDDFNVFDFTGDYSKVNLFYPETDHFIDLIGTNLSLKHDNITASIPPNKEGKKSKILEKKAKNPATASHIKLDVSHGLLFLADTVIKK